MLLVSLVTEPLTLFSSMPLTLCAQLTSAVHVGGEPPSAGAASLWVPVSFLLAQHGELASTLAD